jgi:hypothetical protein
MYNVKNAVDLAETAASRRTNPWNCGTGITDENRAAPPPSTLKPKIIVDATVGKNGQLSKRRPMEAGSILRLDSAALKLKAHR